MAYGDLPPDAPEKPNKGQEGGACNRQRCQAEPALWYNHGSHRWYCEDCAKDIGGDWVNERDWYANFARYFPRQERFPMFETREMMDARERTERTSPATIAPRQQGKTEALTQQYTLGKGRLYFDSPLTKPEGETETSYTAIVRIPGESRQVRRARERAEFKALPPGLRFPHRYRR